MSPSSSQMLGDVDEPTAPFGCLMCRATAGASRRHSWLWRMNLPDVCARMLDDWASARPALCHLAWAQVLAKVSGREDVVFGTVLFGRMQGGEGADRVMGLFINTLPVRIRIGEEGVEASVAKRSLRCWPDLMRHEHASLALAQRCSAVPAPAPLFSSLLNYRHNTDVARIPIGRILESLGRHQGTAW